MLRINVVAVLGLGALLACSPTELEGPVAEQVLKRQSSALTYTRNVTLNWSGTGTTCLNCRTSAAYACSNDSTAANWNGGAKSFTDPVGNNGDVVIGATATVYGRCRNAPNNDTSINVTVRLNSQTLGSFTSQQQTWCDTDRSCEANRAVTYTNTSGIPGYAYGGSNTLTLLLSGGTYCVSHVELTLTVAQPRLQVSPLSLSFGNRKTGTPSATQPVTVTNDSDAVANVSYTISPSSYSATPIIIGTMAPRATQVLSVRFTPSALGDIPGTLSIIGHDPLNPTQVSLQGRGVASAADISPLSLNFEGVVNGPPTTRTVTVTNVGNAAFSITPLVSGTGTLPYSVTPNTLNVPINGTGTFTVTFAPTAPGPAPNATLTFTTDEANPSPQVPSVALTGTGVNPTISVPNSLAFAEHRVGVAGATQTLTVSNTGTGTLSITNTAISGAGAGAYSVTPGTLNVPGGQSGTLTVTFTPAVEGPANATLTLTTNDVARQSVPVTLSGTGIRPTILVLNALAFGEQPVGAPALTRTLTVSNTGTGTLSVSNIVLGGSGAAAYSFTPGTLSVPATESRTLTVTFNPTAQGAADATLTLTTNDVARETVTVNLSGTGTNPIISVPNSLAFGEHPVGAPALTQMLTVNNTGTGTLRITNIAISGPGAAAYTFTPSTLNVPGGQSGTLSVTFTPTAQGTADATLTLTTNDVARDTVTVALSGIGINPIISVPSSLAFAEHRVGVPGATQTLTVSNTGTGTLRITNTALSGAGAAAYSVTPSTLNVPSGQSGTLSVTFTPAVEGPANATLTLTTNDVARQSVPVTLSGTGIRPTISVPNALAFGEQPVGAPALTRTLTVSNTGTGTLSVSNIVLGGSGAAAYSFTPGTLSVPQGESRNLTVTFNPTAQGAADATLTLTTNDVARQNVPVNLSGTGTNPIISVPNSLAFGEQSVGTPSATRTLTVSNTGTGTLRITNIALTGTGAAAYGVTPSTLSVPQGESRNLTVTFNPTAQGAVDATLTLTTNDVARQDVPVALSGIGIQPIITVPGSLAFGDHRVGVAGATQTLTVSNTGTGTLRVTNTTLSGTGAAAYSITPSTLEVPATETRTLTVTFTPATEGAANATLTMATNDAGRQTVTVALSGTGIRPTISVPGTLAFGEQPVGAPALTRTLTVSNTGTGTLSVSNIALGGSSAAAYSFTPDTLSVPQGESRNLTVTFNPPAQGAANATLTLTTNDVARQTVTVTLSGTGINPVISVPSSLAFGDQRVGAPAATRTLTVGNSGTGTLRITNIVKSGPGATAYTFTPSTLDVSAGQTATLSVTFAPSVEGAADATLTLTTNDVSRQTVVVTLSGMGVRPTILVPGTVAFGEQSVGVPGATRPLTVSNTGTGTLRITNIAKSGPGAAAYTFTPSTLDVSSGEIGVVSVTFTPTSQGPANATLTLTTNDVANPSVTVNLSGTGIQPTISVSPTSLSFGDQRIGAPAATRTLTVTNTGTGNLVVSNITATGPGAAAYSFMPSTLSVPANESRTLTVSFDPPVEGIANATLTLTTNDVAHPSVTVNLSGTGIRPAMSVTPNPLNFGDVPVNGTVTQTLAVSNTGSGTLSITSITKSGAGAAFYTFMPATLDVPAGQSRTLSVTFTPTVEGQADAFLTLTTNEVQAPSFRVDLSGYGGRPTALMDPSPLNFGGVRRGATNVRTVRLSNTGRAPLSFTSAPVISSGPFVYQGPSSATITAGGFLDFQVAFSPTSNISYSATLTLTSNATNSQATLSMTGFGADPQLNLNPTSIFFGDARVGTESARVPVTVSNSGNAPLIVQSLPVTGRFAVLLRGNATLPKEVVAGSPFTFDVVFRPAAEGAASGKVDILTDLNPTTTPTVALSGNGTVSRVELSPNPSEEEVLAFGEQRVAQRSGVLPVIVTNRGQAELEISEIIFSNAAFTITSPALPTPGNPLRIGAGEQRALSVVFTPATLGAAAGRLSIISNAFTAALPLDLSGTGVDGQMSVTPSSVSFATADVGGSGVQQSVVLKNVGRYPLTIEQVNAPLNPAFTVAGLPNGLVLQPNDTWPFTVTFTPRQRGYVSTTAIIESDAVTNPLLNLAMAGTGVAAAVELQPENLTFGNTNVSVPVALDLSIKNVGERDLSVSNISFVDDPDGAPGSALDFSLDSGVTLPLVVAPGQSTLVRLKFTPRVIGLRKARARVFTNDTNAEATLVGVGTAPQLKLTVDNLEVSSLSFGNVLVGTPSNKVIRITNTGNGPLTLSTMSVAGPDAAAFIMTPPTLPTTLQPEGFAEVSVSVRPDAERQLSAQFSVLSNDPNTPNVTLPMSAVGVRQQIQLSPLSLDFGRQLLNNPSSPRTVTVKNSSASRVTLSALSVEGTGASQFTLVAPPLPKVLEAGAEVELGAIFTAVAEGNMEGKLKITFSEPPLQLEVSLFAQGISSVLSIRPTPLDFGAVRAGGARREQPVTIANLSSETITLAEPEVKETTGEAFNFDTASLRGLTIAPGSSIIRTVGYQPQRETLSETTLFLGTTVPPRPRSAELALRGRATLRLITADPGSLDFGRVDVGAPVQPREITVVNKSAQQQRVVVKLRSVEGTAFTVDAKTLADPIPAGGSVTFTVTFVPLKAGAEENEVQVWLQNETEPEALIAVTGHGRSLMGEGGGCSCSSATTGSAGMLALLALLALAARRRRE